MSITIELKAPGELGRFRLPKGVEQRLHSLLDKQDGEVILKDYLADEITAASLVTYQGEVRYQGR